MILIFFEFGRLHNLQINSKLGANNLKNMKLMNLKTKGLIRMSALALVLCQSINLFAADGIKEIAALKEAADSLHSIGRTDSAVVVGKRVIDMSEKSGNPTLIVGANSSQGVYLRSQGKIDEALKCYEKALSIVTSKSFRKNPDQEAIMETASLYINLAVLNLDMQQKKDAANNALLSAQWVSKSEDTELKSMVYGVAGSVLTGCGDLAAAIKYQGLAYKYALESDNREAAFRAAAYAMLASDRTGDKKAAARWREICGKMMPEIQSTMAFLVYYQAECSICLKNNDYKGSLVWFGKILALDGIDSLPFVKFDCYGNMHDAYAHLGDYRNAYSTLLKGYELRNELWEQEKTETLQELTVKYDAKEKELALALSEAKRANTLAWLSATLLLLLLVGVVFIIYVNRQKRRRLQQYIRGLENERSRMAVELHDGVCNDLLSIQMRMAQGEPIEKTAMLIDKCREAVRKISHELMPPEFDYANIDEVLGYFMSKQKETGGNIDFKYTSSTTAAEWEQVPDKTALEIYRIVQEAVGNAVKHSGATEIEVEMSLNARDLAVKVSDNGTYKFTEKKGIGEESMRRRAESLGGSLDIQTLENGSTTVALNVRLQ